MPGLSEERQGSPSGWREARERDEVREGATGLSRGLRPRILLREQVRNHWSTEVRLDESVKSFQHVGDIVPSLE